MLRRRIVMTCVLLATIAAGYRAGAFQTAYRTLDDGVPPPRYSSRDEWQLRAQELRTRVLASAGLVPLPDRMPLNADIFGDITRADCTPMRRSAAAAALTPSQTSSSATPASSLVAMMFPFRIRAPGRRTRRHRRSSCLDADSVHREVRLDALLVT